MLEGYFDWLEEDGADMDWEALGASVVPPEEAGREAAEGEEDPAPAERTTP